MIDIYTDKSKIHGRGTFAARDLKAGTRIDFSNISCGFNFSDKPNVRSLHVKDAILRIYGFKSVRIDGNTAVLDCDFYTESDVITLRDITKGEELTIKGHA